MNFIAYIQRQKNIIRRRHEEETFLVHKGEIINVTSAESLFERLDSMEGLNKRERAAAYRRARQKVS